MGLLHVEGARELSQAEIAYEAIAPVYDEFTAHYDTEAWLSDLLPHLERCGLSGNRLLDVGCGTGESFIPMLAPDWQVTGCRTPPGMRAGARATGGRAGRRAGQSDQLPLDPGGAGSGTKRNAPEPRPRRVGDVRREHAARLPNVLR